MENLMEIKNHPGYYFTYDPDDVTVPIRFYTLWKQYGQTSFVLTEDIWTELKQHKNREGYLRVHLRNEDKSRIIKSIHRIVADNLIENPFNLKTVDHIDNNKLNNHPTNLQWLSLSYNSKKNALTNEKSAAKARSYEITFNNGEKKTVYCLKDFSRDSNGYYSYHCLCKLAQNKNRTHKNIIGVKEL